MMKKSSDWDIKDKVKLIAGTIEKNDNDDNYNYFTDLISFHFSNDKDLPVIQEKMNNLMNLLNKEGMDKLGNMDFETEIWDLI